MGGRGAKSGLNIPKEKRGQYKPYDMDEGKAFDMLQTETGLGYSKAEKAFDAMSLYFGGNYSAFTSGRREEETKIIDDALSRMGAYNSTIYRGIKLYPEDSSQEEIDEYINSLKSGSLVQVARKSNVLSSWSSDRTCAVGFASGASEATSIIFTCKNNNSAVGVRHLSVFGEEESEVLAPSTAKWKVKSVKITTKGTYRDYDGNTYENKHVEVEVEEI